MKGIELPINTLIVIVIAVLVLLGVIALWMGTWGSGSQSVTIEAMKTAGCAALMRNAASCTGANPTSIKFDGSITGVPKYDVKGDGVSTNDNLQGLCDAYYGTAASSSACRIICGCGG